MKCMVSTRNRIFSRTRLFQKRIRLFQKRIFTWGLFMMMSEIVYFHWKPCLWLISANLSMKVTQKSHESHTKLIALSLNLTYRLQRIGQQYSYNAASGTCESIHHRIWHGSTRVLNASVLHNEEKLKFLNPLSCRTLHPRYTTMKSPCHNY